MSILAEGKKYMEQCCLLFRIFESTAAGHFLRVRNFLKQGLSFSQLEIVLAKALLSIPKWMELSYMPLGSTSLVINLFCGGSLCLTIVIMAENHEPLFFWTTGEVTSLLH
ncbi:hypothetical protein HAX54_004756 [Datura stramonium]|uniref:Uncharacterized protein n=1 Tax=Datura stramonium TaxID=4076 RepID=A0ABS8T9U0_DATST|nr:hypothetical protein [Datura stramonium]